MYNINEMLRLTFSHLPHSVLLGSPAQRLELQTLDYPQRDLYNKIFYLLFKAYSMCIFEYKS